MKVKHMASLNIIVIILLLGVLSNCSKPTTKFKSEQKINDSVVQVAIFEGITKIIGDSIPQSQRDDSLAILILPLQASCPLCRKKTIDSIVSNQNRLPKDHFIIISYSGGRKTINFYFKEQEKTIPKNMKQLFIDSSNIAYQNGLYEDKPTFYYAVNNRVYMKVTSVPRTIRKDLHKFFHD